MILTSCRATIQEPMAVTPPLATVTPMPTSAPTEAPSEAYRGIGYALSPQYQIMFSPDVWQLENNTLYHKSLAACAIELRPLVGGVSGAMQETTETYGGFDWLVRYFIDERFISYYTTASGANTFVVFLRLPAAAESVDSCRSAAKDVMHTFKLAVE